MRAFGAFDVIASRASKRLSAVLAGMPASAAAAAVVSAGRVFFSPGIETAFRLAACWARGARSQDNSWFRP